MACLIAIRPGNACVFGPFFQEDQPRGVNASGFFVLIAQAELALVKIEVVNANQPALRQAQGS
jgi:hypothetical protein